MWTVSLKWNSQANSLSAYLSILKHQKRCSYLGLDMGFIVPSWTWQGIHCAFFTGVTKQPEDCSTVPKAWTVLSPTTNQAILSSTQLEPRKSLSVYSIITTSNEGLHVITISFQVLLCEYCCIVLISRTTCIRMHLFFLISWSCLTFSSVRYRHCGLGVKIRFKKKVLGVSLNICESLSHWNDNDNNLKCLLHSEASKKEKDCVNSKW